MIYFIFNLIEPYVFCFTFTVLLELLSIINLATWFVPDRVFLKDTTKEIILPTLNGQMGILQDHIPILTGLDIGCAKL